MKRLAPFLILVGVLVVSLPVESDDYPQYAKYCCDALKQPLCDLRTLKDVGEPCWCVELNRGGWACG